jgi:hypothetical protein
VSRADAERRLAAVVRARLNLDVARAELDRAIRSAVDAGATFRAVAEAAGTSHETARRIATVERAVERADKQTETDERTKP